MKPNQRIWMIVFGIVMLGALLRGVYLTRHDSYTDEVLLAFRAIGMIDYDTSSVQTSPWQWFAAVPWWAHWSFHDHPVLFFAIQHASMNVFGISLFAVRLPTFLAGIFSLIFIFLIGRKLFGDRAGIFAAALLAVQSYHVWVSRIGIQDGMVIFLMLVCVWLSLLALERPKWWIAVGAVFGLGMLTKYTFAITGPIILFAILAYRKPIWKNKYLWAGLLAALAVMTPIFLYNGFLYRTTGHFDFQISAALGQNVPEWTFRLGRALAGDFSDRFFNFFLSLRDAASPLFLICAGIACASLLIFSFRKKQPSVILLSGAILLMWLWFFATGSSYRFVVMIIPFLVLAQAWFADVFLAKYIRRRMLAIFFAVLYLISEFAFSANTFIAAEPRGKENIAYARTRSETENFGFNELNAYLDTLLKGKVSALVGEPRYAFLNKLITERRAELTNQNAVPDSMVIVYDGSLNPFASLWVLQRRLIYEGWPIMTLADFLKYAADIREKYYFDQGAREVLYIAPALDAVRGGSAPDFKGKDFQKFLEAKGIRPEIILNNKKVPAFLIYHIFP